jgi:DNA polymerase-3 subunit alpha
MEKESIGLFITEHPLKRVREALRLKADCGCADVMERKDGEWIRLGGMVAEAKKIRTRTGTPMMFATLDDLEGTVELVVFEKAMEAAEGALALDEIVLVRGRVDHKGRGEMSLVVAEAEPFEPGADELAAARAKAGARATEPIVLRISAAEFGPQLVDELKSVFQSFPGDCEVQLEMATREGTRRLRFGREYCVSPSAALRAELDHLLGPRALAA